MVDHAELDDGPLAGIADAQKTPFDRTYRDVIDQKQVRLSVAFTPEAGEVIPRCIRFRFLPFLRLGLMARKFPQIVPIDQERLLDPP